MARLRYSRAAAQAGVPEGLFVQAVSAGGPAAAAGLRPDDVITSIDGEPATSNIQLQELTLTKLQLVSGDVRGGGS